MLIKTSSIEPRSLVYINGIKSRRWKGIVWHHSLSPNGETQNWNQLVYYHTSYRVDWQVVDRDQFDQRLRDQEGMVFQQPWRTVGYHFGTEMVSGTPILYRGRSLDTMGIHTRVQGVSNDFNQYYLGVCVIGNYKLSEPSPLFWEFNLRITRALQDIFGIETKNILSHNEALERINIFISKECPGRLWDMEKFRRDL